jgi:signal-transduction protein with cAMP-binding, CBS, and nucleotidyltransferase domain
MPTRGAPVEALERVPLFADLSKHELQQIARLFKPRRFAEGETVVQEGSGGAAFYVIESGDATVLIRGKKISSLAPGATMGSPDNHCILIRSPQKSRDASSKLWR